VLPVCPPPRYLEFLIQNVGWKSRDRFSGQLTCRHFLHLHSCSEMIQHSFILKTVFGLNLPTCPNRLLKPNTDPYYIMIDPKSSIFCTLKTTTKVFNNTFEALDKPDCLCLGHLSVIFSMQGGNMEW
jgi:hypothetical protein